MTELLDELDDLSPEQRQLFGLLVARSGAELPVIPRKRNTTERPLSFIQERLWFLDQLTPACSAYKVARLIRMRGKLNLDALERSFSEVIRRHEIMRTTCFSVQGKPVQRLEPAEPFEIAVVDLPHFPGDDRQAEALRLANEEIARPVDLSVSPLLRARLFRIQENELLLLLTTHHYISDAPAIEVMLNELSALYREYTTGTPSHLADLPYQYVDYAEWQHQLMLSGKWREQLEFWKDLLSGFIAPLELPTDYPRPAVFSYKGEKLWFDLPEDLANAIRRLSQQNGVTIFMTLLGAFHVLLHRYSGQNRLLVGTIVSERNLVKAEPLIGSFTNNIILPVDLSGNPPFQQVLGQIREIAPKAYANQFFPFERLVEELKVPRDLSRPPLFQVMFSNHEGAVFKEIVFEDLSWSIMPFDQRGARFDLSLEIQGWDSGKPKAYIEYCNDLFEPATIQRMAEHWLILLSNIIQNPGGRLSELDYIFSEEQRNVLVNWNATSKPVPENISIQSLVEAQAMKTPQRIAARCGNESLTYQALDRRANQIAGYLSSNGVRGGSLVGVCIDRSIDLVAGLLGILKTGAAYVPLDPTYPLERLRYMVQDSRLEFLLMQPEFADCFTDFPVKIFQPDTGLEKVEPAILFSPNAALHPENLAYVIYTSGSSGTPKGVAVPQRALVNFILAMLDEIGIGPHDTLLGVTTLSFDIAGLEIWLPLCAGACLEIASLEQASDGVILKEKIALSGATILQATPATWQMLVQAGWQGDPRLKILCGGESLTKSLARELLERGSQVWNLYGPTETTIWSTVQRLKADQHVISIGRPIANTQVYILDGYREPAAVGVVGEIYIGGSGLAHGYLHQPELTAEFFTPNPFSPMPGARLYRTGDLGRYLPDGSLVVLGRADAQVKLRGFRIEPGEVEATLRQHPCVQDAAVSAFETQGETQALAAYIVWEAGCSGSLAEIREYLKNKLPTYMIPTEFMSLNELPRMLNGKLDRKALPIPGGQRPNLEVGYVAPCTQAETRLVEIWQTLLRKEPIGIYDSFFELGGHSLLAVQLTSRLRDAFQVELSVRAIFENSCIHDLARKVEECILDEIERLTDNEIE